MMLLRVLLLQLLRTEQTQHRTTNEYGARTPRVQTTYLQLYLLLLLQLQILLHLLLRESDVATDTHERFDTCKAACWCWLIAGCCCK